MSEVNSEIYDDQLVLVPSLDTTTDQMAITANIERHRKGISRKEVNRSYTEWANKYDQDLCPSRYSGPKIAAKFLAQCYREEIRPHLHIIDVAAGTGRVGLELVQLGFRIIDALEPSEGMLQIAKRHNVYQRCYLESIGCHQTSVIEDTYDGLIISGGMGEGHIPTKAVKEMIRIVKPDGIICIAMREKYLTDVSDYDGKLEPYMEELQKKEMWNQLSRTVVPNYSFKNNGVVFVYQVCVGDRKK